MAEEFGGNLKKIQWNNRLKTTALSAYFILGVFIFTTMFLAAILVPLGLYMGFEGLMKEITGSTSDIVRLIKPYIKVFAAITAAFLFFMYTDLKNVGDFFGAERLNLKHDDLFYKTIENFCIARGLAVPDLYITREDGFIPDEFVTGVVTQDFTGKASLVITPSVYHLDKPHLEAYLAQVVQRIHTKDTLFLTLLCFIGFFPFHLKHQGNPIFNFVARPFLYVTDIILKPVRDMIINMRFARLDVGALELTKEKQPMDELLDILTPLADVRIYIEDAYLPLFLAKTNEDYRKMLLIKA